MIYYLLYASLPIFALTVISFTNSLKYDDDKMKVLAISKILLSAHSVILILLQLIADTPNYYNIMLLLSYIVSFTIIYGNVINNKISVAVFVIPMLVPTILLAFLPTITAIYLVVYA